MEISQNCNELRLSSSSSVSVCAVGFSIVFSFQDASCYSVSSDSDYCLPSCRQDQISVSTFTQSPSRRCRSSLGVSCSLACLLRSVITAQLCLPASRPPFRWWEVNTEKLTAAAERRAAVVIRLEQHEDRSLRVTVRGREEREAYEQQRRQTGAAAALLTHRRLLCTPTRRHTVTLACLTF